ncbi:MAG: hypothetical protein HQ582_28225 [Planctomycetes bacterium]|nr:hypothetical protein [Planctomycetota bacterium]
MTNPERPDFDSMDEAEWSQLIEEHSDPASTALCAALLAKGDLGKWAMLGALAAAFGVSRREDVEILAIEATERSPQQQNAALLKYYERILRRATDELRAAAE